MNRKNKLGAVRLILIIATLLSVIFSSVSCLYRPAQPLTKDEILANIASEENADLNYNYVTSYLRVWRMPSFDSDKLKWMEYVVDRYYNLEGGTPPTLDHAVSTANLFMEHYYDNIDLKNRTEVTDAIIDCYVTAIGDPYSIYRAPEVFEDYNNDMSGTFGGIGVVVEYNHTDETIMVSSVYKDSPAEAAGIKVGDFIYAVGDKTIEEIGYLNAVYLIRGEIGTDVEITVKRGDELIETVATRAQVVEKTVEYEITEDGYGYIAVTGFKENTDEQFAAALSYMKYKNVKGIVFDMRNNPGGYVNTVCTMVSMLVPSGTTLMSYQYKGQDEQFIVAPSQDAVPVWSGDELLLDGNGNVVCEYTDLTAWVPVTVICNEYTASAAEIFTAAVRDYTDMELINGSTVGVTTFKKGIMQSSFSYTDDSYITLTVAYYNPPCGVNYHLIGVTPEYVVENTETEDRQYIKAFEVLEELVNANNN